MNRAARLLVALLFPLAALLALPAHASTPRSSAAALAVDSSTRLSVTVDTSALELRDQEPSFAFGEASLLEEPRAERFHLDGAELLSEEPRRAPPVGYPETRVRAFDFLGQEVIGVYEGVSAELHWGCDRFGLGKPEGNGINLYAFVGQRPHEKTDPLGLAAPGGSWASTAEHIATLERLEAEAREDEEAPGFWSYFGSGVWNTVTRPFRRARAKADQAKDAVKDKAAHLWDLPPQRPVDKSLVDAGANFGREINERGSHTMADISVAAAGTVVQVVEWEVEGRVIKVGLNAAGKFVRVMGGEAGPAISRFPEWRVGDPITKVTVTGAYPSWETVRARYWMNRAASGAGEFSKANATIMAKGFAPKARAIVRMRKTGELREILVEKELHHSLGNRGVPTFDDPRALREVWPWEHEDLLPAGRKLDYDFVDFAPRE